MKVILIVLHLFILSIFYLIGVGIQNWLGLPIPGSIIGMLLLFFALMTKVLPVRFIEEGSTFILKHMPLLFLPVTVGILQFLDLFAGDGILLIFITLISTIIVMIVSGWIGQNLVNRSEVQKK
ncbi:CidA/LrgA family protein [Halalkalibacter alkalisediminis]|uniref:CidA/LrgA family protein n=1 Tax=Halalkalibacter alkalisediminis TaxID=935616 RepID=A0ABV6NMW6_9BACI|nr:CidA/LrgA family protein [Halalkalibacter alkalisediminis]